MVPAAVFPLPPNSHKQSKDGGKEASGSDAMDYCGEEDDEDGSCDDSDSGEEDGREQGEAEQEKEESDDEEPEGAKKAAAAMAVGVGNLSDPENCQVSSTSKNNVHQKSRIPQEGNNIEEPQTAPPISKESNFESINGPIASGFSALPGTHAVHGF